MLAGETIFLTGFPGFIASRLLQRLAMAGCRLLILVQPPFLEKAKQEIANIVRETGRALPDFRLLEGDITLPDLGLGGGNLEMVRAEANVIFHLAAIYDLAVERTPAFEVNAEGTANVNALVRSLSNLRHYHYVSTCYVAGRRQGRICETELAHNAGFRNFYEESKYQAETKVNALKTELPITIHRPSLVCGDSHTGETAKYDGVYYLIRYLLKWPSLVSRLNIGNDEVSLNLVPIDFVVEAMIALAREPQSIGKTVQIADPQPLSTFELFNTIARYINGSGSQVRVPVPLVKFSLMLPFSPAITGLPHHAVPYFFLNQSYDTAAASQLLKPHGVTCPRFSDYVDKIVDFAVSNRIGTFASYPGL